LRNLAEFHGWGLDEPTCFGLGSGLGFTFYGVSEPPERVFVGRPLALEVAFHEHLGIEHVHREGERWAEAWARVRDHLDDGRPVLAFVDLYHLDYYDTDTHFAPHALLVVGYDEGPGTANVVHCADSEFETVQRLPLDSFEAAWSATATVPLANRYLVPTGDPTVEPVVAAERAVGETCRYMLDPEDSAFTVPEWGAHGLPGIRALATDVEGWTALEEPHRTCRFAYQNVEVRGTGGGAFRGLYTDFLDRWERELGLSGFADEIHELATAWTRIGERWREASETDEIFDLPGYLGRIGDDLSALADREERFYEETLEVL
jgi:hypothetical protein